MRRRLLWVALPLVFLVLAGAYFSAPRSPRGLAFAQPVFAKAEPDLEHPGLQITLIDRKFSELHASAKAELMARGWRQDEFPEKASARDITIASWRSRRSGESVMLIGFPEKLPANGGRSPQDYARLLSGETHGYYQDFGAAAYGRTAVVHWRKMPSNDWYTRVYEWATGRL